VLLQAENAVDTSAEQHIASGDAVAGPSGTHASGDTLTEAPAEPSQPASEAEEATEQPTVLPTPTLEGELLGGVSGCEEGSRAVGNAAMKEFVDLIVKDLRAGSAAPRYQRRIKQLQQNDWWVRAPSRAQFELSPDKDYIRDVYVEAPHLRFPHGSIHCPRCKQSDRVSPKQFQTNASAARCVVNYDDWYGLLEFRYKCGRCQDEYQEAKSAAQENAGSGSVARSDVDADAYSFMPHEPFTQAMLEHNCGVEFPVIVTPRAAVDKRLMDYMRALVDGGVAIETFSDVVSEIHIKRYKERVIKHESIQKKVVAECVFAAGVTLTEYSTYYDKGGYHGYSPSARYWRDLYKAHAHTLRGYLDIQVKMRSGEDFDIDASYKLNKKLANMTLILTLLAI